MCGKWSGWSDWGEIVLIQKSQKKKFGFISLLSQSSNLSESSVCFASYNPLQTPFLGGFLLSAYKLLPLYADNLYSPGGRIIPF